MLFINIVSNKSSCVVDNGASFHVRFRKDLFTSYPSSDYKILKMDNAYMMIMIMLIPLCEHWKLTKDFLVMVHRLKCSSLHWTKDLISYDFVNVVEFDIMRRLVSEKRLNCLANTIMAQSWKSVLGHHPFRKLEVFELVHFNLCGLMNTRTFGGALDFVSFIYYHSRKLWVYALKSKNHVFDVFK
ncbi:hypothetical protein CR513_53940, partial [Mucuna pruriens]